MGENIIAQVAQDLHFPHVGRMDAIRGLPDKGAPKSAGKEASKSQIDSTVFAGFGNSAMNLWSFDTCDTLSL